MATLDQMRELKREHGGVAMRLAVAYLFEQGAGCLSTISDEEELERLLRAERPEGKLGSPFMTESFELSLCKAAWKMSTIASAAEVICWCQRRGYFSIYEWGDGAEC